MAEPAKQHGGMGHNQPTIPEIIAEAIAPEKELMDALRADANAFLDSNGDSLIIKGFDEAAVAKHAQLGDLAARAQKIWNATNKKREGIKAPHLQKCQEIDSKFNEIKGIIFKLKDRVSEAANDFSTRRAKHNDKLREEKRLKDEQEEQERLANETTNDNNGAQDAGAGGDGSSLLDAMDGAPPPADSAQNGAGGTDDGNGAGAADAGGGGNQTGAPVKLASGAKMREVKKWRVESFDPENIDLNSFRLYFNPEHIKAALQELVNAKGEDAQVAGVEFGYIIETRTR